MCIDGSVAQHLPICGGSVAGSSTSYCPRAVSPAARPSSSQTRCADAAGEASPSSRRRGAPAAACHFRTRWARTRCAATVLAGGVHGTGRGRLFATIRTAAASSSGSNMPTTLMLLALSGAGCIAPEVKSSPAPTSSCPCHCIGPGCCNAATTKQPCWRTPIRAAGGPPVAADWLVRRRRTPPQGHLGPDGPSTQYPGCLCRAQRPELRATEAGRHRRRRDDDRGHSRRMRARAEAAGAEFVGVLTLARALRTGA